MDYKIQMLSLLIGTVLPLISGLVTKASWGGGTRAVVLLALSAFSAFITTAVDAGNSGSAWDWGSALITVGGTFLAGVGTHFGLWNAKFKGTSIADIAQRVLIKDQYTLGA